MGQIRINLETEFPILGQLTFFNHAGVSPLSARAAAAIADYAQHAMSRAYVHADWYRRVDQVKDAASRLIHAQGEHEIALVANTSTGISMVASGLDWQPGDRVVISNAEYPANRYPWEDLKRFGVEMIEVAQQPDGRIDLEDVIDAINDRTRVVSVSHVQYASGFCIDLRTISQIIHRAGGYLCVDAIQSMGAIPVDVRTMGIDFLAADGHKWLLGPEGCGILYVHEDLAELLHPSVIGWMNMVDASDYGNYRFEFQPDARRFEPGSYNIAGMVGLGASIELLLEVGIENVWSRIEALTVHLADRLVNKGYRVFSPRGEGERSGIVMFEPPYGRPRPDQIALDLEARDIVIVVREGRLRASPHFYNTLAQIDALADALP